MVLQINMTQLIILINFNMVLSNLTLKMISTFTIHRTVYPAVRPYSNGNRYAETPILTTSRPIPVRQPTGRGRRRDYNIRGYKDGWVEESGRRQKLITTTTRRPVYSTTYPTYPRTRRPIPTIARLATIVVCHYKSVLTFRIN